MAVQRIVSRDDGSTLLYECEAASLKEAIEKAVRDRVDLSRAYCAGADLRDASLPHARFAGADFTGAVFHRAYMIECCFREATLDRAMLDYAYAPWCNFIRARTNATRFARADLTRADFTNADLTHANFIRANLENACFQGARVPWRSHDAVAEILRQHAGKDPAKRMIAGLVIVSRDWCWRDFAKALTHDEIGKWVIDTLWEYVDFS